MWPYFPELLAKPVPRYTSFPTAAEFGKGVGPRDLAEALDNTSGDISLYVHIPFCEKICWYCGCNTSAANRRDRLASYLEALHHEIAIVGQRLGGRTKVRRIAFGGGSPNAITPTDFVRLVNDLTIHFRLERPVMSIELDPRTLSDDWGQVLSCVGISNASMGVQTFDPQLQKAIGRVQPDADIERGTELLRKSSVTSVNFDLMYGLPGQTVRELGATLARAIEMRADRIALFGYAHVPHMLPRQRRIDASVLPDQAERFAMAWQGYSQLTEAGYQPVGFDHFALPGDPLAQAAVSGRLHRNFQGFTDDAAPVMVGLGATAISSFPELLIQNEKNAGRYRMLLSQGLLTGGHGIARSAADRATGAVIESLLCQGEAQVNDAQLAFAAEALVPYVGHGLASFEGRLLRIEAQGLPYARTIAAAFDPYRQLSQKRFSSAV